MTETKKIPCRVCGKLFVPCAYCQAHSDVFRWRNFACSIECAEKYVAEAIDYRAASKSKNNETFVVDIAKENSIKDIKTKKIKKVSTEIVETENKETE